MADTMVDTLIGMDIMEDITILTTMVVDGA
jgi:hypothetical protein